MAFRRHMSLAGLALLCVLCLASSARGDLSALGITGEVAPFPSDMKRVLGWEFTTGSDALTVTALGVYDSGRNGLVTAHDVAIYRFSDKTSIVSATVPSGTGSTLLGFFRYVDVTPVVLDANTRHVIAASWTGSVRVNGDPFVWAPDASRVTGFTVNPSLTLGSFGRYEDMTDVLEFPDKVTNDPNAAAYLGPNFRFGDPVPEASTLVSLALCLAAGGPAVMMRLRRPRR